MLAKGRWDLIRRLNVNIFITFLYMFRALLCSSSGGQIVSVQPLVSSLSLDDCSVHRVRKDCRAVLSYRVYWTVI